MDILTRKTFKFCFMIICTIVVAFMIGFWFYKYGIEDRDIGVVDYAKLKDETDIAFPAISVCLNNPFLDKAFSAINSNVTQQK